MPSGAGSDVNYFRFHTVLPGWEKSGAWVGRLKLLRLFWLFNARTKIERGCGCRLLGLAFSPGVGAASLPARPLQAVPQEPRLRSWAGADG